MIITFSDYCLCLCESSNTPEHTPTQFMPYTRCHRLLIYGRIFDQTPKTTNARNEETHVVMQCKALVCTAYQWGKGSTAIGYRYLATAMAFTKQFWCYNAPNDASSLFFANKNDQSNRLTKEMGVYMPIVIHVGNSNGSFY